ncbi:MAG: helix-turn-helix domain-containing protein [Oscillospiraceae bacterium]|nr:helix-turn-helix domain-containing protein [Oscillospiraceae bacterium]
MLQDNTISAERLAEELKVSKRTILRDIDTLKKQERINRIESITRGYWKVTNEDEEI